MVFIFVRRRRDGGRGWGKRGFVKRKGEFQFNVPVLSGVEIRFPPRFQLPGAQLADFFVINAFSLSTDFCRVFAACGADVFGGFLEAPGTFPETPAGAGGVVVVVVFGSDGDPRHAHL